MDEKKPCPFCGKVDTAEWADAREVDECGRPDECDADECRYGLIVCCFALGGCGSATGYYMSKEEATEAWNRRASDAD